MINRFPRVKVVRFPRTEPCRSLVINVRGTNGSGKTTVIFQLMKHFGAKPLRNKKGQIWAYRLKCDPPMYIVGRYETPTGGCDTIRDVRDTYRYISKFSKKGDVIFEGLILSGMLGELPALVKKLPHARFIFAILDTPLELCFKRVLKRRADRGTFLPFNFHNVIKKQKAVLTSGVALKYEARLDVRNLPYEKAVETILNWRKHEIASRR